jgi:hypothetical protein
LINVGNTHQVIILLFGSCIDFTQKLSVGFTVIFTFVFVIVFGSNVYVHDGFVVSFMYLYAFIILKFQAASHTATLRSVVAEKDLFDQVEELQVGFVQFVVNFIVHSLVEHETLSDVEEECLLVVHVGGLGEIVSIENDLLTVDDVLPTLSILYDSIVHLFVH